MPASIPLSQMRKPQITYSNMETVSLVLQNKEVINQGNLKYIGGYIREVNITRWGKFSIGPRCYLKASLAFGLVEVS